MSTPPPPPRRRTPGPIAPNAPLPPPPDPVARAARRAEAREPSRRRTPLLLVAAVVVAVALIAGGVIVASGGDDKEKPKIDATTSVELELGALAVESVVPFHAVAANFPAEASAAALAVVERYVHEGTVTPLRTGVVKDAKLAAIFDDPAVARLATTDRGVLFDEGLPKAIGKVTVTGIPVALTALLDANKTVVLITATIDLDVQAEAKTGAMTVKRTGTLVMSPQLDGTWKITAWTLHVDRGGPGVAPTPTDSTAAPTDATTTTVAP